MATLNARTYLLRDLIDDLVADNEAAADALATGRPRGPITGLAMLDEALGGRLAEGLHLLQAAPGAGKTAAALQIAADCQFPALFVSAEMPLLELFRRLIARGTGTYLRRLSSGELTTPQITDLARRTVEKFPALALVDATIAPSPADDIVTAADALRTRMESPNGNVLVVVDSLQAWARGRGVGLKDLSEYDLISGGVVACREIAARLKAPVLAISQRNRAGQAKGGLHAGKGSGDLEYAAETVAELTVEDDTRNADDERRVTLSIHKNRHGQAGIEIPLWFSGRLQSFREA